MHGVTINISELQRFSLFEDMPANDLEIIAKFLHCRNYPAKTQLITEGDPSLNVYFILRGQVNAYLDDDKGKEIIINSHSSGEYFGELGLIQKIARTASIVTVRESRLAIMSDSDFKYCLEQYPKLAMNLIHQLVNRVVDATESIRKLGLMDVYGRIAVTFFNMSEEQGDIRVIPEKLTQQAIASHVGASREMVARILKDLKTGGYIEVDKGIISILKPLPHNW